MTSPQRSAYTGKLLTVPNGLTILRLAMIPVFLHESFHSRYTAAFALFVGAGLTDIIDGFIARRFNQRSRLGAVLDPAADKTMMISGYVMYTIDPLAAYVLPVWLTFTVFIRDALIVFFAYLLHTRVNVKRFPPSVAGKISTLLQVVTLSATIAGNTPLAPIARPLMWSLWRLTLVVTLYSGADYLRRGKGMLLRAA